MAKARRITGRYTLWWVGSVYKMFGIYLKPQTWKLITVVVEWAVSLQSF